MKIDRVIVGSYLTNCYILSKDNKCLIIDPGDDYLKIKKAIGKNDVVGIIITHHHFDHTGALVYFNNINVYDYTNLKEGMNNILAAIDAANNGYSYFPFSLERFCTHGITDQDRLDTLSTQEMKVFRYILSGIDYTTIGSKMNISNKTVSTYKVRLMDKLGCGSLLELYDFAQRNKIG